MRQTKLTVSPSRNLNFCNQLYLKTAFTCLSIKSKPPVGFACPLLPPEGSFDIFKHEGSRVIGSFLTVNITPLRIPNTGGGKKTDYRVCFKINNLF